MGFYTCGPTVYWDAHIGNMRTIVNSDIIKRVFIENGYDVSHVMNFTDVGHLTSDADSGDDKMEKGAARENMSVWDVAQKYINNFLHDADLLNIMRPTHMPRATDHVKEQIELVQKLEALGYTYEIPDEGIYYDTSKFAAYGALGPKPEAYPFQKFWLQAKQMGMGSSHPLQATAHRADEATVCHP